MLILVENGLSARKFGRNDRSPDVSPGFRRDFEGSAYDPATKREFRCKAAVRGGFAPGPSRATGSGVRSAFGGGDVRPGRRARCEARVEQREQAFAALLPPVPSERPFDELPVQVLAPK